MVYLTQLIYVVPGREREFHQFEDTVLPLLAAYRGELVLRLRPPADAKIAGSARAPYEVHIVRFETDDDLARYASDDRRQRVLHLKNESVESVVMIKGALAS
jgi:antibiotic biosynthesis monooxygenase (ABM) superfamily enzyme